MKHYLYFSNVVIFMYILFFTAIILKNLVTTTEPYTEPMSLRETVDADKLRTSLLSGKVTAFQPTFDQLSQNVNDNTSNIKTTMDTITTVLKQKVNNVNQRVGKDITDKDNAPAPITGTTSS